VKRLSIPATARGATPGRLRLASRGRRRSSLRSSALPLFAAASALALAACGSKKRADPCDDLRGAVDRMYAQVLAENEPGMSAREKARAAEVAKQVSPAFKAAIVDACRADHWPTEIVRCMASASTEAAMDDCESRLPAPSRARVEDAMKDIVAHIQPPDEPAQDDDDQLGAGESGVPACDDYARAMQAYLDCDRVPDAVKKSARDALDTMRATWPVLKDPKTPAASRQTAADACTRERTELETSAQAMGCSADAGAPPVAGDCGVLGPMIGAVLAEQLRDVPADKQAAAQAQAKALAAPLERTLVDTCTSGRWSASATACFGAARSAQALVDCEARLTPEQADKLAHAMNDVTQEIAGGAAPAGDAGAPVRIAACDDYVAFVNRLLTCDKLPAGDRTRMQQSMALLVDGIKRLSDPSLPAAKEATETCTRALDAAKALSAKLGC
jgi:hypothetical protein